MKKCLFVYFLCSFLLMSCEGMKSEIKSPYYPSTNLNQKPNCPFKLANNCWQRSLDKVMACLDWADSSEPEYFSNDFLLCESQSGKTIRFENKFDPNLNLQKENMNFRAYNKSDPCFQFIGNASSFVINSPDYGSIAVNRLENGDTHVSCLDGESFLLTSEIKEKGCRDQKEKVGEFLPAAHLISTTDLRSDLFSFLILGHAGSAFPIFSCQIKK